MQTSRAYRKAHWVSLILIYLVIIAGSVVRTSGSGMGCPDWPKCFGYWVPPTDESSLPPGIDQELAENRVAKAQKFAGMLRSLGMDETAERIEKDPFLYEEEPFNVYRTWTEYINRLLGFLAGNLMLLLFGWTLLRYRKNSTLLWLTFLNLIFIGFEGWLGSIVVASNLVPWTITLHLFFALVILLIQAYLVERLSYSNENFPLTRSMRWLVGVCLLLTFAQMFLGTQVRESVDELVRQGMNRTQWLEQIGWDFWLHRSFSWLVLILLTVWIARVHQRGEWGLAQWIYTILAVELISGITLAYWDVPRVSQVLHLILASLLLGLLWHAWLRSGRPSRM